MLLTVSVSSLRPAVAQTNLISPDICYDLTSQCTSFGGNEEFPDPICAIEKSRNLYLEMSCTHKAPLKYISGAGCTVANSVRNKSF